MRAAVFEKFGEPADVLQVQERTPNEPGPGEVLVRMLASPINPSDLMYIRGNYSKTPNLPAVPGFEGVGIVEKNGGGLLGRLLLGNRVAVINSETGNWQEKTIVPAKQAIAMKNDLSLEQAATFFVNPATAYILTQRVHQIPRDAWLVQTAAGSALGRMIIRLGKYFGFRTLNIVRSADHTDELKSLGANAILQFDPTTKSTEDFREEVLNILGAGGARYAIDPVGGATASAVATCLGDNGKLIVYGTLSGEPLTISPRTLMTPGASIEGFWLGRWMAGQKLLSKLQIVRKMTRLIRQGLLVSEVGETFSLDDVAHAVREAEKPARNGKVLLRLGDES